MADFEKKSADNLNDWEFLWQKCELVNIVISWMAIGSKMARCCLDLVNLFLLHYEDGSKSTYTIPFCPGEKGISAKRLPHPHQTPPDQ